jgi:methyl-accepting chemotaxis protein
MSGGVLVVELYGLNSKAWRFFERELTTDQFSEIATVVLAFLFIGHLVFWVSDYIAYSRWFKKNEISNDTWDALGSFSKSTEAITDGLMRRINRLKSAADDLAEKEHAGGQVANISGIKSEAKQISQGLERIDSDISEIKSILYDVGPGWKQLAWTTRVIVFGWNLVLPVTAAVIAVVNLNSP